MTQAARRAVFLSDGLLANGGAFVARPSTGYIGSAFGQLCTVWPTMTGRTT
jgi:hypothetical protein